MIIWYKNNELIWIDMMMLKSIKTFSKCVNMWMITLIISITLCFWDSNLQSSLNELVLLKWVWHIHHERRDWEMKFFLWMKNSLFSCVTIDKNSESIMKWVKLFKIKCIRLFRLWRVNWVRYWSSKLVLHLYRLWRLNWVRRKCSELVFLKM